jgi:hypothetical protein
MSKSSVQSEPLWPHLRYATLSDVLSEIPGFLGACLFITAVSLLFYFVGDYVGHFFDSGAPSTWTSPLPHWMNYPIFGAIALWIMRGKTIHYQIPMLTVSGWVFTSVCFLALAFLVTQVTGWLCAPLLWTAWLLFSMIDTLDAKGRENFEALNAAPAEAAR